MIAWQTHRKPTIVGFTLAEILVVVFIIGIVTSLLIIQSGGFTYGKSARDLSRQIVSFCEVIQQQAILQPAVLGLAINQRGYAVYRFNQNTGAWQSMAEVDKFWRESNFPSGLTLSLQVDKRALQLPTTLTFGGPQIIFTPSGEITPFVLRLQQKGKGTVYQVSANFAGELTRGAM